MPMPKGIKLNKKEWAEIINKATYCRLGKLIYLLNTRIEIIFVVCTISRCMQNPRIPHMDAAKHILCYLKGTLDLGITYH